MAPESAELKTVTWNPVTGCNRVSAGCDHPYALTLAGRLKRMGVDKYQNDGDPETSGPGFGLTLHPQMLGKPYGWKRPRTVFVTSMSDLFHPEVPPALIRDTFKVMAETPQHTYQVLTKRPGRARNLARSSSGPITCGSVRRSRTCGPPSASTICGQPRRGSSCFSVSRSSDRLMT